MQHKITCVVCGKDFTTTNNKKRYCSDECAYIGTYIVRPAALEMSREEAIIHYRTYYRDRLIRGVGRSRYIPHLRHILKFCQQHNRMTFTCAEVAKGCSEPISPNTLGAIHRRHGSIVERIHTGTPNDPSVWRLTVPEPKNFRVGRVSY